MTTNSDGVKWSVIGPMIAASIIPFGALMWAVLSTSSTTSGRLDYLSEKVHDQADAMKTMGEAFGKGKDRMDDQDRHLREIDGKMADIKDQLAALKDQVAQERAMPIRRQQ